MNLNPEKQKIIEQNGNVLVTANPGTGKTLLLAHKYLSLVKSGISPKDILCLTFTDKAKREMEQRIINLLKENKLKIDFSELNIYTFHSYALQHVENNHIISSNLLRYVILRYLKDNQVLNYGDQYLLETIVPKMENLIRYLKSYGILPEQINLEKAKPFLQEGKSWTKEEIDIFAEQFVRIYSHYESTKKQKGCDYNDLLLDFLKLKKIPIYEMVLVDELQDVNTMEADIALRSGKEFFAVGDKKQAIFGFQGGSITNFKKFQNSTQFVLSENFRSTNEILLFAREYVTARTTDDDHKKELANLKNPQAEKGEKPYVYEIERDAMIGSVSALTQNLLKTEKQVAIIARTNGQVMDIAKELKERGINCSSTHFSASNEAKIQIILFVRGLLSNNVEEIKQALFTTFFPIPLQKAFEIVKEKYLDTDKLLHICPELKEFRESIKTIEDVNVLFREKIIPVCVSYGKEYIYAGITLQDAFQESLAVLAGRPLQDYTHYLESSDMLANESDTEKQVVVTTVHKAKGKEFDCVIYVPAKTNERSNFQDMVVEGILKSEGIDADEELEEETLRVNFVAFTRAKRKLFILTEKPQEYISEQAVLYKSEPVEPSDEESFDEKSKRAFSLFVSGKFDEAKTLLYSKEDWIRQFVKSHFEGIDRFSFSYMTDNAYDYFVSQILNIRDFSFALNIGTSVHDIAESIVKGEEVQFDDALKPYVENVKMLLKQVTETYSEVFGTEIEVKVPLSQVFETDVEMTFKGKIDVVFKNKDEYFILDWKTSARNDGGGEYRQQLEVYKRAFSSKYNIPLSKIKVAIGYVGLRERINTGRIGMELDAKQPAKSAYNTINQKVQIMLRWKKDIDAFLIDFVDTQEGGALWKAVVEILKYKKEEIIEV